MTRSFRSLRAALCATGLLVLAAGGANAQTLPTTTTDFTLPTACQATVDETHGEEVRACIRALRAELAQNGDDHQGLGQWVSTVARDNGQGQGQHDGDTDDDSSTPPTTGGSSTSGSTPVATTTPTATNTPSSSTAMTSTTSTTVSAQSTPTPHDAQPHGHKHGDN